MHLKPRTLALVLAVTLALGFFAGQSVRAVAPLPGSPQDPAVTKSYLDQALNAEKNRLAEQVAYLTARVGELEAQAAELKQQLSRRIVLTIGSTTALVDGRQETLPVAPRIVDGRTMVPFRFVGEALGAEIGWDQAQSRATFTKEDTTVTVELNSIAAWVNGQPISLDAAPILIQGTTLVPVALVAGYFGAQTQWDPAARQVTIMP